MKNTVLYFIQESKYETMSKEVSYMVNTFSVCFPNFHFLI